MEDKWYDYIEMNNGESEYDEEFNFLKSLIDLDLNWETIMDGYYYFIEMNNGESEYDEKFVEFKRLVNSNQAI